MVVNHQSVVNIPSCDSSEVTLRLPNGQQVSLLFRCDNLEIVLPGNRLVQNLAEGGKAITTNHLVAHLPAVQQKAA